MGGQAEQIERKGEYGPESVIWGSTHRVQFVAVKRPSGNSGNIVHVLRVEGYLREGASNTGIKMEVPIEEMARFLLCCRERRSFQYALTRPGEPKRWFTLEPNEKALADRYLWKIGINTSTAEHFVPARAIDIWRVEQIVITIVGRLFDEIDASKSFERLVDWVRDTSNE